MSTAPALRARLALVLCGLVAAGAGVCAGELGIFEREQDIGSAGKAGSALFDPAGRSCVVRGGGENMWFTNDAFHFVWTQIDGDCALSAAIEWPGTGGNAHRKACLMFRQGLEADSPYVDVAVHGDGLVSLQYRDAPGGMTREIQANPLLGASTGGASTAAAGSAAFPVEVGLRRQGEVFFLTAPPADPPAGQGSPDTPAGAQPAGAFIRLKLAGPLYAGLAVCAHDNRVLESARFSRVALRTGSELRAPGAAPAPGKPTLHCTLETVNIASKDRRAIYHTLDLIEAPNWTGDGRHFLFNSRGRIYRLAVTGGTPEPIDTGFATRCNNDHGLSPDGLRLAVSDQSRGGKSLIYVLPAAGGVPRLVTALGPSYWHGWSPDGSTLTYCGERDGEFDVYAISVEGGQERRLTTAKGLDDGPEFTPDGKFIYFNSERSGSMQIWRMQPDGSGQEAVTSDPFNNWFAHPSPDGKWLVFLTYEKGVAGHPANQPIRLRLMPAAGGPIQDLARLFGGQGTINVPSWSPDSKSVAFVSYEVLTAD